MLGDERRSNRDKILSWRLDTLRRSPLPYWSSPTSRSRRNSNVFLVPMKTARRSVTTKIQVASRWVPMTTLCARTSDPVRDTFCDPHAHSGRMAPHLTIDNLFHKVNLESG